MKLIILLSLLSALSSCTDNFGSSASKSYLKNDSGLTANLNLMREGYNSQKDTSALEVGESKLFSHCFFEGVSKNLCYPVSFGKKDSAVLIFSNNKRITYYSALTQGTNLIAIPYTDVRNFLNFNNWEKTVIKDQEKKYDTEFIFIITREDYLRAR